MLTSNDYTKSISSRLAETWFIAGNRIFDSIHTLQYNRSISPTTSLWLKYLINFPAICLIGTVAIVESVAYTCLFVTLKCINPQSQKIKVIITLEKSTFITALWTILAPLLGRRFQNELELHEVTEHALQAQERARAEQRNPDFLIEGALFLSNEIFTNETAETIQAVKEFDLDIFDYILSKAIYIYAFGSNKDIPEIPIFFKADSIKKIKSLRAESIESDLERIMSTRETFNKAIVANSIPNTLKTIRAIASEESQGGKLVTVCWKAAADFLET